MNPMWILPSFGLGWLCGILFMRFFRPLKRLRELASQYIATLDNQQRDERWGTDRAIAENELDQFFKFIESQRTPDSASAEQRSRNDAR